MDFNLDLGSIWLPLAFTVAAHALMLRRLVRSVIDPIVYVALGTVMAIALTYALLGTSIELLRVIACVMLFWTGVCVMWPPALRPSSAPAVDRSACTPLLIRSVAIATLIFLIANLLFFVIAGVPALADNPTLAKVDSYAGGLGIVRRINWGLGLFVVFGLSYLLLNARRPWVVGAFVASLVVTGASGSKGALLPALFSLSLLNQHPGVRARQRAARTSFPVPIPVLAFAALTVAIGILISETGDLMQALVGLLVRLLYSADVMIYWQDPDVRQYFAPLGPLDYLPNLLNSVAGALRLTDYQRPLGSIMVQLSIGANQEVSESFGPNVPFYVKGVLFFGIGGFVYAFLIGVLTGWLRSRFQLTRCTRPLRLCVLGTLVLLSPSLPIDDSLFVSTMFDFLAMFALVLLLARMSSRIRFSWARRVHTPPTALV